jgi:transposase-like protein
MDVSAEFVPCPKCRAGMTHVTVTPHPKAPEMLRNTFVCYSCNQTRTYVLPADAAAVTAKQTAGVAFREAMKPG